MVDFLHDRLQILRKRDSKMRPTPFRLLKDNDYPVFDDYGSSATSSSSVAWKPIHTGVFQIQSATVDAILIEPSLLVTPSKLHAKPTITSEPVDDCVINLATAGVIDTSQTSGEPTMYLFLNPKDENTARVICDLRPFSGDPFITRLCLVFGGR